MKSGVDCGRRLDLITRRAFLRTSFAGPIAAPMLAACTYTARSAAALRVLPVRSLGGKGTAEGSLRGPIGIAIDAADRLYVTDLHNGRIQRYGPSGESLGVLALPRDMETSYGSSASAGGIAVDGAGLLYVALMMSHRVLVLSPDGETVAQWGRHGAGAGELDQPGGVAVDAAGIVYVADQGNRRIQRFSPRGEPLGSWGGYGREPGRFDGIEGPGSRFGGPHYIALDGFGHAFTTEGALGRIQMWSLEGEPLAAWGTKGAEPGGFGEYRAPFARNTLGPIGICADRRGRVWVSSLNGRVQLFTATGTFLTGIGGVGSGHGEFVVPHAMSIDSRGSLYVVDSGNHRVQQFAVDEGK